MLNENALVFFLSRYLEKQKIHEILLLKTIINGNRFNSWR